MNPMTGGCLCEKVRYKVSTLPISQGICFCRQCQKVGSASGSPLLVLFRGAFECSQEGLSSTLTQSDDGSIVTRNFCRQCGTHIFAQIDDAPEIVTVRAGTLDDVSRFVPEYVVWTRRAAASFCFPAGIPLFAEEAPIQLVLKVE